MHRLHVNCSCGYPRVARVDGSEDLDRALLRCVLGDGPFLILVKVGISPIEGIPRVSHSPTDIRDRFMNFILKSRLKQRLRRHPGW